jgi:phosphoribosylformylglycinamidine synthase
VLRYAEDVNGALGNVAGVVNEAGNVMGLMPHPEHAVDPCSDRPTEGSCLPRSSTLRPRTMRSAHA